MKNDPSKEIFKMADEYNIFGSANINGAKFQSNLSEKFKNYKIGYSKEYFDNEELKYLKPIIAHSLIRKNIEPLFKYPQDGNLSQAEKLKTRTQHSLKLTKAYAECGAFNCEIAHFVVFYALINKFEKPVEVINFSGIRDDGYDRLHSFSTINCPEESSTFLQEALGWKRIGLKENQVKETFELSKDYLVIDAYHKESYSIFYALTDSDKRLARYDEIESEEKPAISRFLHIRNPKKLYEEDNEIRKLCDEIIEAKNNTSLKEKTKNTFCNILLTPFKLDNEESLPSPEKACMRAAIANKVDYLDHILETFKIDINAKHEKTGNTALHFALTKNRLEPIAKLISLGADLDIENSENQTQRILIAKLGNEKISQLVLKMDNKKKNNIN